MWSNFVRAAVNATDDDDMLDEEEDGWDDDDDELPDDEDEEPADSEPATTGRPNVFMGRLTRFLEQVTQPEDDDVSEGWGDEDDGLEDEEEELPIDPMGMSEKEASQQENGWDEDEDIDVSESPHQDQSTHHDDNVGLPKDEEQNDIDNNPHDGDAWGDDYDDLDFSEQQQQHDEPPATPALDTSQQQPVDTLSPDTAGVVAQAQQDLQAVLDEIDHQEEESSPKAASGSPNNDDEISNADDERHARSAVQAIQNEMNQMNKPKIVDHLPSSSNLTAPDDDYNNDPSLLVRAEDVTRDTGGGSVLTDAVYDDENELAYGPVVDQLPPPAHPFRRQDSMAVQAAAAQPEESLLDDDEDISTGWGSDNDEEDEEDIADAVESTPAPPPVVDHLPKEDEERSSTKGRTQQKHRDDSVGVLASEADSVLSEGLMNPSTSSAVLENGNGFGPVVDHIPTNSEKEEVAPLAPVSGSLAVHAQSLAGDFEQDEDMDDDTAFAGSASGGRGLASSGWEEDDIDVEEEEEADSSSSTETPKSERKTASFSPNLTVQLNHIVDHTPSEMVVGQEDDPSMHVLATTEDLTRDTGKGDDEDVYDDENELEFGPVVDHTPQTPRGEEEEPEATTNNSLAVDATDLKKEIEEDEKMDESFAGDTTLGGTMDGTDGGWDDVTTVSKVTASVKFATDDVALVDHTPAEMDTSAPPVTDPSIDVVASEATTEGAGEGDSTDGNGYGPVVDQTPNTPAGSGNKPAREDSVVVQVPDLDTVDEDTLVGESTVGTYEEEMPPVRRLSVDDQLVDHVPNRPASRFGDASTLVAADPSEVLSEVDDMQEDGNYGPVVDQTPSVQAASVPDIPSGAGSTVAFAPSVPADDLDDADETDLVDEPSGWEEDAEPNPQSGNEEPIASDHDDEPVEEPIVVDFVPEEEATEAQTVMREQDISVLTVGGAQSILHEDKEDYYGLVVDQTPNLQGSSVGLSQASVATQLTASECRAIAQDDEAAGAPEPESEHVEPEVVVDQLPNLRDKVPADSLATVARSQLSEDDVEEDDSKFGPVVDHLPTPRPSFGPSRGGSTVDALGTVSEANSDAAEGEGWDDDDVDVDFDVSEGGISDALPVPVSRTSLRSPSHLSPSADNERSMSVRFDSSVNGSAVPETPSVNETTYYYDPEAGDSSLKVNETQYFDPESGISGDWASPTSAANQTTSLSFAEADTPPSTPYRRSEIPSPDVEEEMNRNMKIGIPLIGSTSTKCGVCANASGAECPCVQELLESSSSHNGALIGSMTTIDGKNLKVDFNKLLKKEMVKRRLVEEECHELRSRLEAGVSPSQKVEVPPPELVNRVAALENECVRLRNSKEGLERDLEFSKQELKKLRGSEARLSEMEKLETERVAARMKENIVFLEEQLADSQKKLAEALQMQNEVKLDTDETNAGSVEVERLREAKDVLSKRVVHLEIQHEEELKRQYQLLDNKTADLRALESSNTALEEEKTRLSNELVDQRMLASQSESLAKELLSVAEERDVLQESLNASNEAIAALQKLIDEHGMERNAIETRRDAEIAELKIRLRDRVEALESCQSQILSLQDDVSSLAAEKQDLSHRLRERSDACQALELAISEAKSLTEAGESNISALNQELVETKAALDRMAEDRDILLKEKEALTARIAEVSRELQVVGDSSQSWQSSVALLEKKLAESETLHRSLVTERDNLAAETKKLTVRFTDLESSHSSVVKDLNARLDETERKSQIALESSEMECNRLRGELETLKGIQNDFQNEQSQFAEVVAERDRLNEENEDMLVQFGLLKQEMDLSEEHVMALQDEIKSLQAARSADMDDKGHEVETLRSESQRLAGEVEILKETIQSLERSCSEKDEAIEARDRDIGAFRDRLTSTTDSSEMLGLENKLYQKEQDLINEKTRADSLEEKYKQLRVELDDAKGQLAAADDVIDLRKQVESLSASLQSTRERLASKEEEVDRLTSELTKVQAKFQQDSPSRTRLQSGDSDDVDTLKSRMVQLAIALERSEQKRAEAIERLRSERQTNAESLRRLSESMKRYYSTVTSGDT